MTLELLEQQFAILKDRFDEFHTLLMEVRDRQLSGGSCPAPGLCLDLRTKVNALENRLNTLETDRLVIVRGWKAFGIVVGVASAVATAGYGIWSFIEHMVHRKP
jgi:hypothetical protein